MKTQVLLWQSPDNDAAWQSLQRLALATGCAEGLHAPLVRRWGMFQKSFDAEDPRLAALRQALAANDLKWSERRQHSYSSEELMSAPLLLMSIERAPREIHRVYNREQFDFSGACLKCGTGAVEVGDLVVNPSVLPKRGVICHTDEGHCLLGGNLPLKMMELHLKGCELIQVQSARKQPLPWWQFVPRYRMPPFAPETRGLKRSELDPPCDRCGRDGYFSNNKEPIQLVYRRCDLRRDGLPDVACTYEAQGCSVLREPFSESQIAKPMILVGPRVFEVFHRHKVRGLMFEPITILDQ